MRVLGAWVAVVALTAVACAPVAQPGTDQSSGTDATSSETESADAATVVVKQVPPAEKQDVPSALDDPEADELPAPLIDVSKLKSGGPPPDGIPAIDEPKFQLASGVDWLEDDEPVLVLEIDGETRAYPVQVMLWHEIVNDTFGERPVAVTYCPLCNSALAFDRRINGDVLTFGTSGMLLNSDLVMYDRQTESLWPQLELKAVAGVLTGTELEPQVLATVPWKTFMAENPDALVLSRDTGVSRDYGRNPYTGYDQEDEQPFLFDGTSDPRLAPKAPVVGLFPDEQPTAVRIAGLQENGPANVTGPDGPVVVWISDRARSALDTTDVASGRIVPTTASFSAEVDGRKLTFSSDGDRIVDKQTGSVWRTGGRARSGPLSGKQLAPVQSVSTFWFAWAAFQPETIVVG